MAFRERLSSDDRVEIPRTSPLRLAWNGRIEVNPVLPQVPTADDLFLTLDGSDTIVDGQEWKVEVYGVLDEPGARWLQLGLTGPARHMVTLRLAPGTGAERVLSRLQSWLANQSPSPWVQSSARSI